MIVWKEDDLYVASFVELELASQGKTKKEAIANVKEALALYLEDENVDELAIPTVKDVSTQTIQFP